MKPHGYLLWVSPLLSLASWSLLTVTSAEAQFVQPNGLGTVVNTIPNAGGGNTFEITGGTNVGRNLFHSFSQFNVPERGIADFRNELNAANILARITDGRSDIAGMIRSTSNANLFLMNPRGIIFGRGAQLDIRGSFVATTATAIQFPAAEFSATSAVESTNPLLSVNPSALFFNQVAAAIENRSTASAGTAIARVPGFPFPIPVALTGLRIANGRSLLLVGGDVILDGGRLNALQGRVDIAGVTGGSPGNNTVALGLDSNNNPFLSQVPAVNGRANVSLSNRAQINAAFGNTLLGGTVAIAARDLTLVNSAIFTGTAGREAGGDIRLNAQSITLNNQSRLVTSTTGEGRSGDIRLEAQDTIFVLNGSQISNQTRRLSGATQVGNAGNTLLQSGNAIILDQSSLSSRTAGPGPGGSIKVRTGALMLKGSSEQIASINAGTTGAGDAGKIVVEANSISLEQGTLSTAAQLSQGDLGQSGNIEIRTGSLSISGDRAGLFTSNTGNKPAGDIILRVGTLTLTNNSQLSSETRGEGRGGNIEIEAKTVFASDSFLLATTRGAGTAGNIQIKDSDSVTVVRLNPDPNILRSLEVLSSGLFVSSVADGSAGTLTIETGKLQVQGGARISASTTGPGPGGTLLVNANNSVELVGKAIGGPFGAIDSPSGLFTETFGSGSAGNLIVTTPRLLVREGAQISASTSATGNPGNILVTGADSVSLSNGSIASTVNPTAVLNTEAEQLGNITIQTRNLSLENNAQLSASTSGQGNAGNILVQATEATALNQSSISTAVNAGAVGRGGNIDIQTGIFSLANDAQVSASTVGQGNAGSVRVFASTFEASQGSQIKTSTASGSDAGSINLYVLDAVTLVGERTGLFANTDSASSGNGGSIFIDPRIVTVRDGAKIAVDSQGSGTGGSIDLQAGRLVLENGEISAQTASNNGGDITLQLQDLLLLRRNSQISTTAGTAQAGGNGGNIRINAPFVIAVRSENSDITANAFTGTGGRVTITTQGIFGIEPRDRLTPLSDITASSEFGIAGVVTINTPDVDPSRGLTELPANLVDASNQIAQGCGPNTHQAASSFVVTGRGGLPPSPTAPLNNEAIQTEWVTVEGRQATGDRRRVMRLEGGHAKGGNSQAAPPVPPIVEAQGWVKDGNGEVVLFATTPAVQSQSEPFSQTPCPVPAK
ncbi:filamentous hemagglutinin N-terminal domain-containing protein [Leptothermofonsia sp. ETS-13]|uniref:two-partner secretion domain-containing protein n=1 Tax=Leptothermofonsia sp. ETS-13 TaxID=3035696 RepID=UPI003BA056F6